MDRHIDQWDKIKSPEIDTHKYRQLIFDKEAKTMQWKIPKIAFSKTVLHAKIVT